MEHHPRSAALHAEPAATSSSSSRHTLALERRQLVFGGMEGADDRPGVVGEDYERQRLGSEGAIDRAEAVPEEIQTSLGPAAAAVGDGVVASAAGQSGLFAQEWVSALY